MAQFRVKFNQHFASYNAGETGYFTSGTAQALVTAGLGTAVDALVATSVTPVLPPGMRPRAYVTRRYVPVPASQADSDTNAAEAAVLAGF